MTFAVVNAAPGPTNTNDKPKKLDSGATKSSNSKKNLEIGSWDFDRHRDIDDR